MEQSIPNGEPMTLGCPSPIKEALKSHFLFWSDALRRIERLLLARFRAMALQLLRGVKQPPADFAVKRLTMAPDNMLLDIADFCELGEFAIGVPRRVILVEGTGEVDFLLLARTDTRHCGSCDATNESGLGYFDKATKRQPLGCRKSALSGVVEIKAGGLQVWCIPTRRKFTRSYLKLSSYLGNSRIFYLLPSRFIID